MVFYARRHTHSGAWYRVAIIDALSAQYDVTKLPRAARAETRPTGKA
jgi:hypothetical protein